MSKKYTTANKSYTRRLVRLEHTRWKELLDVQRPYRWNILRQSPGKTLDIGCGIGRYLRYLPAGSVGIDHNEHSINYVRELGLTGYTTKDFSRSKEYKKQNFDCILLSHVLEHMTIPEGIALLLTYKPLLRKNGKLIICCPQEKGYASDMTHVTFLDSAALSDILEESGFNVVKQYSFPFARVAGKLFVYNEFIVVGQKIS